jgi:hypothetical protein
MDLPQLAWRLRRLHPCAAMNAKRNGTKNSTACIHRGWNPAARLPFLLHGFTEHEMGEMADSNC